MLNRGNACDKYSDKSKHASFSSLTVLLYKYGNQKMDVGVALTLTEC